MGRKIIFVKKSVLHLLVLWFGTLYAQSASCWVINEEIDRKRPQVQAKDSQQATENKLPVKTLMEPLSPGQWVSEEQNRQIQQSLTLGWNEYVGAIRESWKDVLVSNAYQWVHYSDNYAVRNRVDFKANNIDVTLKPVLKSRSTGVDFEKMNDIVQGHLAELLGTTLRQAIEQDPLFLHVWERMSPGSLQNVPEDLVLSELFSSDKPTEKQILHQSRRLMANAQIRYQQKLANNTVRVDLTQKLTYTIPLPDDRLKKKARQFRSDIVSVADQLQVPTDLIYAIIHTESHFNPLARSPIPAYGLMQIVPKTAGRDATKVLFDQSRLLSPAFLYNPRNNIRVGAAYLKLLYDHYLQDIQDPKSRLYCAIAAYNTGVVNVARAFGDVPAMDYASGIINQMTASKVLSVLLDDLPARETRDYLKKVLARKSLYDGV